jgi:ribosomal protein S18 acetylase RimI-like enzyme
MAETTGGRVVSREREAEFLVRPLTDRDEIRWLLEPRRAYAAYALGQLEPLLFSLSRWWQACGDAGWGLLLHSRGGLGNALFVLGETSAVEALLSLHPGPRQTFITCEPHHLATVERFFVLTQRQVMLRMTVTPATFRRFPGSVRRLCGADVRLVNRLYRTDGAPAFYLREHIESGVYYGAFDGPHLVAVAGTHVVSPEQGIAVVGNVYTHPAYRNQGLAKATTSAVTEAVLKRCHEVVLSVDPGNAPAVAAYRALGYQEAHRLIEGSAVRRSWLGIRPAVARFIARTRGKRYGAELARVRLPIET